MRTKPIVGSLLTWLMDSLDTLTSAPFIYLTKSSNPIDLHRAVQYISANEMSNHIYVVHFVDDRKAIRLRSVFSERAQEQINLGHLAPTDVDKFGDNLLMHMFQDDANLFSFHGNSQAEDENVTRARAATYVDAAKAAKEQTHYQFELRNALTCMSADVQKLVHTVAILDAFYT